MPTHSSVLAPSLVATLPDFGASFPSAELVGAAAGLLTATRHPEADYPVVMRGPLSGQAVGPSLRKTLELYPDTAARTVLDRMLVEGPRWYVSVTPGTVSVRRSDPARALRAYERSLDAARAASRQGAADLVAGRDPDRHGGVSLIREWSSRSRARMLEVMASLDYAPMFADEGVPGMVTLTYPGDWQAVAPNSAAARRHLLLLRKRFEREYGRRLRGVWKREFQRRGAPHVHMLMVVPITSGRSGLPFREWLSSTWADVVAAECCGLPECLDECERRRHLLAGTGIDFPAGLAANDPRRVGAYFLKHGSFADKEYQNRAPDEWAGSVGRFWGVWGLDSVRAAVEVAPCEGLAAARVMRRHSRANSYVTRVPVWRYRTRVDSESGEVRAVWRKATTPKRVYRLQQSAGYLLVEDGPAFAGALATHLDRLRRPERVVSRSGSGPVGFLP